MGTTPGDSHSGEDGACHGRSVRGSPRHPAGSDPRPPSPCPTGFCFLPLPLGLHGGSLKDVARVEWHMTRGPVPWTTV